MAKKSNSHKFKGWGSLPELRMSCVITDKNSGRVLKLEDKPIKDVMQAIDQKLGGFL